MKKQLTHLEILENENLIAATEKDKKIIEKNLNKKIELQYDELLHVYNEAGTYIADLKELNGINLSDIKTLKQLSDETGIYFKTLAGRLKLKSFNMIEGVDYRRMGKGQGILLSPQGVEKILKGGSKNV